jgi:hypothetical protein
MTSGYSKKCCIRPLVEVRELQACDSTLGAGSGFIICRRATGFKLALLALKFKVRR